MILRSFISVDLLTIATIFLLNACSEQKKDVVKVSKSVQPSITIQSFSKLPPEIDGCNCIFSRNEKDLKDGKFIFTSSMENNIAYMTINDSLVKFKLKSSGTEPNTFTNFNHKEVFFNNDYIITIDVKHIKNADSEVWVDKGTITIVRKDGQKLITKFYGECGC